MNQVVGVEVFLHVHLQNFCAVCLGVVCLFVCLDGYVSTSSTHDWYDVYWYDSEIWLATCTAVCLYVYLVYDITCYDIGIEHKYNGSTHLENRIEVVSRPIKMLDHDFPKRSVHIVSARYICGKCNDYVMIQS